LEDGNGSEILYGPALRLKKEMLLKELDKLTDEETPAPRAPLISLRLMCTLVVLAGLLLLAHGCHPDEDTELFNLLGHFAH
jgi:hypothetical protein